MFILSLTRQEDFVLWSFKHLFFPGRVMNTIYHFQCSWSSAVSTQQLHINTQRLSSYMPVCINLTDFTPMLSLVLGIAFPLKWSEGCTPIWHKKWKRAKKNHNPAAMKSHSALVNPSGSAQIPTVKSSQTFPCSGSCSFIGIKAFLISWW